MYRLRRSFSQLMRFPIRLRGRLRRVLPRGRSVSRFQSVGRRWQYYRSTPRRFVRRFPVLERLRWGTDNEEPPPDHPVPMTADEPYLQLSALRTDFSQIHLIDTQTDVRHVVHIGYVVGQAEAELELDTKKKRPTKLMFTKVDKAEQTPIYVRAGYPDDELIVDGVSVTTDAPLADDSTLILNGRTYRCELYALGAPTTATYAQAAWATSVGPRLNVNQDALGVTERDGSYLFAIADGVGGGYAGEAVSEFAVKYLLAVFEQNAADETIWGTVFEKAFSYINAEVRGFASKAPNAVGTTLTALLIRDWMGVIGHVGDSRVYLYRGGQLQQVTTDHEHEVDEDMLSPVEAPRKRSVLQRAIGKRDKITPEQLTLMLQPHDKLLLITDGITNRVSDAEIAQAMMARPLQQLPEHFVTLANQRHNTDNASVIAVELSSQPVRRWDAPTEGRVFTQAPLWSLSLQRPMETETQGTPAIHWAIRALMLAAVVAVIGLAGRWLWFSSGDTSQVAAPVVTVTPTDTRLPPTVTPVPPTPTRVPLLVTQPPAATTVPFPPTATLRPVRDG